jgi:hypothetical protein
MGPFRAAGPEDYFDVTAEKAAVAAVHASDMLINAFFKALARREEARRT